jgi:hypothetical protein
MGSLKHKTFSGKKERDVISASYEVTPERVGKRTTAFDEFGRLVELTMRDKKFGSREIEGASIAVNEMIPNALNYCEPCTLTAQATVTPERALIKFSWKQAQGADLAEVERVREAELKALMAGDPAAYDKSLCARIEKTEAEGKIGGIGQGLFLVKSFCDGLSSPYDPSTHSLLVVVTIENRGRALSSKKEG